jgi:flagellar motor switch protein FliN/FliY
MDMQLLEDQLKVHIGALEAFLKQVLLRKVKASVPATSPADGGMVADALRTGTVVVKVHDNTFDVDGYVAFDDNWIPQLSTAMLGVEEKDVNEITRDLIKEFTAQLVGQLQTSLKDAGITIQPGDVDVLKSAQIAAAVAQRDHFIAQVEVSSKFEIEGDEQPDMAMILAFAIPDQDKIDAVLGKPKAAAKPAAKPAPEPVEEELFGGGSMEPVSQDELDDMFGDAPVAAPAPARPAPKAAAPAKKPKAPVSAVKADFDDFNPDLDMSSSLEVRNLEILKDVELDISVELGRKEMPLGDVLHLVRGSVVELNKLAGEPVEVYANGHRIAEGEVVVIDEHFGVRITNLVSTQARLESLR